MQRQNHQMARRAGQAVLIGSVLVLAACDPGPTGGAKPGYAPVSDTIRAMAAPHQNVDTARVLPEDGCYWYEHSGPVETTLLPLRTAEGRPICTQLPPSEITTTEIPLGPVPG
ncbi:MAG: hypothetical protein ACPGNV_04035 [Mangrovicoccus sp.]